MFKKIILLTACALMPTIISSALAIDRICIKNNLSKEPIYVFVHAINNNILVVKGTKSSCINNIPLCDYSSFGGCRFVISTMNYQGAPVQVQFTDLHGVISKFGYTNTNFKIDSYFCDASTCHVTVGPDNSE